MEYCEIKGGDSIYFPTPLFRNIQNIAGTNIGTRTQTVGYLSQVNTDSTKMIY